MYHAHEAYLESRILSADPIELVRLLYQGCTSAVREARRHLAAGEIAARSRSITRAWEILTELTRSLDLVRGGEISLRLRDLYDYMQRQLLEANLEQTDPPLAEVLGLLATLSEAWEGLRPEARQAEACANPWSQPLPSSEPVSAHRSHAWSF